MPDDYEDTTVEETLVEMAYRWADIEEALPNWFKPMADGTRDEIGSELSPATVEAFRVEAHAVDRENDFGDQWMDYVYVLLFDVENRDARDAAQTVRNHSRFLGKVIKKLSGGGHRQVEVRVVSVGTPAEGAICGRPWEPPPKKHIDVTEVPSEKPESTVPLTKRDNYWLTPIEVPFYDALRETGAIFAVQPWVQGVEGRFRPDFIVFYDGGTVVVELDGHDTHKTREQRTSDARRQRWFEARKIRVLRWTGSEVHANPEECVRELLDIVRGRLARV